MANKPANGRTVFVVQMQEDQKVCKETEGAFLSPSESSSLLELIMFIAGRTIGTQTPQGAVTLEAYDPFFIGEKDVGRG